MSFLRYPVYKDSGVEWLGEVPADWKISSLKRQAKLLTEKSDRRNNPIGLENVESWSGRQLTTETEFQGDGVAFERGDILFGKLRPYLAKVLLARESGEAVGDFHVLRPSSELISSFLAHAIRNREFIAIVDGSTYGAKMPRASWEYMGSMLVAVPPISEQTAIAGFLDRETAKIDALVAEQQNLIALLKEKRQALISHAVTKGLDPDVPMKDSGVAWLGEVPAHWRVCSLRRAIAKIEQGWSPDCHARPAEAGEWGVLKAGCVNGGKYRPTENKALPSELLPDESYCVEVGDVLMSRASGSPDLVGSTALVRETPGRLMLSDKIFRLRLEIDVAPAFFVAMLNARALRAQIEQALSGGNGLANNLPQSNLLAFICALPPEEEQVAIAARLNRDIEGLDQLMAEAESTISLLIERRTGLISAAVTGKIDVRRLAVASAEPAPEPA